MSIRKYLSPRVVGAALAVGPAIRATRRRPLGVRVWVVWLAWAGSLVLAVQTVREKSRRRRSG